MKTLTALLMLLLIWTPFQNRNTPLGVDSKTHALNFRLAEDYAGSTVGEKVATACTSADSLVVLSPGSGQGELTGAKANCLVLDLRPNPRKQYRLLVGSGSSIQEVLSFGSNIGTNNPMGRLQVFSEIGTIPGGTYPSGPPLGNDLALVCRGAADCHIKSIKEATIAAQPIHKGVNEVEVADTKNFYREAPLVVGRDTDSEEEVAPSHWTILDNRRLRIDAARPHPRNTDVEQVGTLVFDFSKIMVTTFAKASSQRGINPGTRLLDGNSDSILLFPNDGRETNPWPNSALQIKTALTGLNGRDADLLIRNHSAGSSLRVVSSDNARDLLSLNDIGNVKLDGKITANQFLSTFDTGQPPLSVRSTTPVPNLTATPTTYSANGNQQVNIHIVSDEIRLSNGTAQIRFDGHAGFLDQTSYRCTLTDETDLKAVSYSRSTGRAMVVRGSSSDLIQFTCIGR